MPNPNLSAYPDDFRRLLELFNYDVYLVMKDLKKRGDVESWKAMMEMTLADYAQSAWITATEGSEGPKDLIKAWVAEQLKYFAGFAAVVSAAGGKYDPAWENRARMYGSSLVTLYWEAKTEDLPLPAMPGQGTQCLGNCRCQWDIHWLNKSAGDADCYWKLGPSDHCQTCLTRAEQWNPIYIRGGDLWSSEAPPPAVAPTPTGPQSGFGDLGVGRPPSETHPSLRDTLNGKNFLIDAPKPTGSNMHDPAFLKDQICKTLEKLSGLSYNKINDSIHQWAISSNDSDFRSLFMQKRASELFGAPFQKWQQDRIDAGARGSPIMHAKDTDTFLRSMYEHTQAEFAKAGITKLVLFRGASLSDADYAAFQGGQLTMGISTNAMSSWSSERATAASFASGAPNGVIFHMEVPVTRIIGSARTGFGCWDEHEFVLLGSDRDRADLSDIL